MNSNFSKSGAKTFGLLCVLLGLAAWGTTLPNEGTMEYVHELINHAREQRVAQLREGGYYESLMRPEKGQTVVKHTIIEMITLSERVRTAAQETDIYKFNSFRIYEARPNLDFANSVEGPVKTDSHGLFDYEHSLEKPANARRIALFGDSVIRGFGVSLEERFSTLLEKKLNSQGRGNFEIVNFAVPAYYLPQTYDVVLEKAPAFHPDVYVLGMTDITGARPVWSDPLIQIIKDQQDLKYGSLRNVVKESGIKSTDSKELGRWKLSLYRERTMRELFLQMKANVEHQSAKLVVFFVPSAQDQNALDGGFEPLRECLKGTGIPIVDASDTFKGADLDNLRLSWHDMHPDHKGHSMIADNLYRKLRENPDAWLAITGEPNDSTKTGRASSAEIVEHPRGRQITDVTK